ncbi:anti-repressor SinI family protein [Alicyclobacillus sp.]|uniref:anti-repressor SinI family protein n=1 Tax=Alicyclobacillus sp. TaxID=61169 RepID=UPI0025C61E0D|nr:anti-repressor SinI family protein [Alicyclobacillus sp.]
MSEAKDRNARLEPSAVSVGKGEGTAPVREAVDPEWIALMREAMRLNLTAEDVRNFIRSSSG